MLAYLPFPVHAIKIKMKMMGQLEIFEIEKNE